MLHAPAVGTATQIDEISTHGHFLGGVFWLPVLPGYAVEEFERGQTYGNLKAAEQLEQGGQGSIVSGPGLPLNAVQRAPHTVTIVSVQVSTVCHSAMRNNSVPCAVVIAVCLFDTAQLV